MDAKTIIVSVVSITIACLLAVTLLIPIISESTTTDDTFSNVGLYYMESPITDDVTYTYSSDGITGVWTVDGETLTVSTTNIIVTDSLVVRGAGATGQIRGTTDQTFKTATFIVSSDGIDYDYTTMNDTNLSGTWTYEYVYCAVNTKADYIMSNPSATTNYMLDDSIVIGFGVTKVGSGPWATFKINGTMESVTVESLTEGVTVTNIQVNKTPIEGYVDLYDFDSVTFTATDSSENTVNATYNAVIIPSEITAERSIHPDESTIALLNIIPLLVIVGIILGCVGLIAYRRL